MSHTRNGFIVAIALICACVCVSPTLEIQSGVQDRVRTLPDPRPRIRRGLSHNSGGVTIAMGVTTQSFTETELRLSTGESYHGGDLVQDDIIRE